MKNRTKQTIVSTEFLIDFLPRPCTPIACPLPTDKFHTRCDPDFVPTVGNFSFLLHDLSFFSIEQISHQYPLRPTLIPLLRSRGLIRYPQSVQPCPSFLSLSLHIRPISNSLNFLPKRFFLIFQLPKQVIYANLYISRGRRRIEERKF